MKKVRIVAEVESIIAEYWVKDTHYAVFDLHEDDFGHLERIAKSIDKLHEENPIIYPSHTLLDVKIQGFESGAINPRWSDNFTPAEPIFTQVASGFFCIAVKVPGLPEYSTYPCAFTRVEEAFLKHEEVIFVGDDPDEVEAWYYAEAPEMTLKPNFEPGM